MENFLRGIEPLPYFARLYDQMTNRQANQAPDRANSDTGQVYDELLVTLIWSGDRQAASRLARRWYPRLLRTAKRLLGEEEAALGVVQETWLSILRGIDGLRDPARFAPWAFRILHRRCADAIRKTQAMRAARAEAPPDIGTPPRSEEAIIIRQAFAALPEDQRLTAQLFFVEGLTLAEIAEVANVPEGTVKSRLFHARRRLKAALSGDE